MILAISAGAWEAVGFAGQALFTARFLVQWLASEKRGESVVPVAFWWLSLAGSSVLVAYAASLNDPVFLLGSMVNGFLYARNLLLIHMRRRSGAPKRVLVPTALAIGAFLVYLNVRGLDRTIPIVWLALGFLGAALWTGRFVIQWYASEREGRSFLPVSFWYVGLAGSILLLAYSVYRRTPVFILGYLFPPLPYVRNLVLIYRKEGAPRPVRFISEVWADTGRRRLAVTFCCLFLAAFLAVRVLHSDSVPGDYHRYALGGRMVSSGNAGQLYDSAEAFRDPVGFAVLFVPISLLPGQIGQIVWTWLAAFGYLAILAVCRRFCRRYRVGAIWLWATFFLTVRFAWDSLNLGEVHCMVVLLATAGIYYVETNRPRRGGALVALGVVMKVWPILLLPVCLVRRRWVALGSSLAALFLLAIVLPAAAIGPRRTFRLIREHASRQAAAATRPDPDAVPGESLAAIAFRVLGPVPFEKLETVPFVPLGLLSGRRARTLFLVAAGILVAAFLAFAGLARSPQQAPIVAGAALVVAILASPEAREPEFLAIALLVTALASVAVRARLRSPAARVIGGAVLLTFLLGALVSRGIVGRRIGFLFEAWCAIGFAALALLAVSPVAALLVTARNAPPVRREPPPE